MNYVALGDIAIDARSGFASGDSDADGVVQIRMNNVTTEGVLIWDKVRRVPRPKNLADLIAEPGDILFNATNSPELVGKSALFPGYDEPVTFSNHFIRLRFDAKRVVPGYVVRWLHEQWMRRTFDNMCKRWVNQASVGKNDLLSLSLPLPPLKDQERITEILDHADSLRRLRQHAIDRLNSLGQAVFNKMFGEQAGNPKRWRTGELMEIVLDDDQINYGVVQPGVETESGVPLVRVADLLAPAIDIAALKKIDAEIESKYKRSRLRGDEVLVGCVGSIGAVTIAHSGMRGVNIARAVGRIPVDPRKANPQFIAEHLKTRSSQNYFRAETRTVAQPTLNIKQLKETPIMLPPLEKQKEFSHIAREVEKEKTSSSAYLESLNAFFSTLQNRAFRGEL